MPKHRDFPLAFPVSYDSAAEDLKSMPEPVVPAVLPRFLHLGRTETASSWVHGPFLALVGLSVFIGDEQSSLARWIHESGGGWVVDPGDVDGLVAAIDEARMPRERMLRGRAAKAFSMRYFDRRTNARRVAAWLACGRQEKGRCLDGPESPRGAPASDGSGTHRSWVSGKDSAGI